MVAEIFTTLGEIVEGAAAMFVSMFEAIVGVFYDTTPETGGLTFLGIMLLLAFGVGVVRWGIGFVRKLISLRG